MVRQIHQLLSDARAEPGPCQSCGQDGHQSLGMDHASQRLRSPLLELGWMGLGGDQPAWRCSLAGWEAEPLLPRGPKSRLCLCWDMRGATDFARGKS